MELKFVRFIIVACLISTSATQSSSSSSSSPSCSSILDCVNAFPNTVNQIFPKCQLAPNPSPKLDPQPIGSCTITVGDKCIDATDTTNETPLQISKCKEIPAQDWIVRGDGTITALGKCIQVKCGETDDFTPVELYDCNGSAEQQWIFLSSGQLKNPHSNKCLDVKYSKIQEGQPLIIYKCHIFIFGSQAFQSRCKPIPPPPKEPQPKGTCEMKVAGKCVAVKDGASASGTPFEIDTCNETPAQDLIVPGDGTIRVLGMCMDVQGGATGNLTPVQLSVCNGSPSQQWVFLSNGQLKNPNSNRCLDVKEAVIQDGQPLIIYDCKTIGFENQAFESSCKPPPICAIKVSDKCVDVAGGNSASGTQLDVFTCNDTPAQDWIMPGDGTIRAFGKCMDVQNGGTEALTPVQLNDCNGGPGQQWVILSTGQLRNPNSNMCLDVYSGQIVDGQILIIYPCHESNYSNQAFETDCAASPA